MWEFSIVLSSENAELAKFIYKQLLDVVEELEGVITSFESCGKISIILACSMLEKPRLEYHINNTLSLAICTFFKEKFLQSRLKLPEKSDIEIYTFKKALICFDRETDRFLVSKFLVFGKSLNLESFFHFRLRALKEKWTELVAIANDNSTYLLGDDSFIELLKFLIDNIDVASEQVFVKILNNKIAVKDAEGNMLLSQQLPNKYNLVEFLLSSSPRKIHWQADVPDLFLEKIFSKRIVYSNLKEQNEQFIIKG